MYRILKSITLIAFICISTSAFSQSYKLGHINTAELLQAMPGVQRADSIMKSYEKQLTEQLQLMDAELQNKYKAYQEQSAGMADAIKEVKEKELMDLQQRIQAFQQTAQEKVGGKKEELLSPILQKAEKAIKDVAKEQGYSYIFDTSTGSFLFAQDSDNIMSLVKKKLAIQ